MSNPMPGEITDLITDLVGKALSEEPKVEIERKFRIGKKDFDRLVAAKNPDEIEETNIEQFWINIKIDEVKYRVRFRKSETQGKLKYVLEIKSVVDGVENGKYEHPLSINEEIYSTFWSHRRYSARKTRYKIKTRWDENVIIDKYPKTQDGTEDIIMEFEFDSPEEAFFFEPEESLGGKEVTSKFSSRGWAKRYGRPKENSTPDNSRENKDTVH